ncbi:MAG: alpha/beta hydrolase, partial [Bacteroidaceae bacterium]
MKRKLIMLALLLVQWSAVQAGRVQTDSVQSKVLGATVKYNVYLPDGFDKGDRMYPVVYLLHGLSDDYRAWMVRGNMNLAADELIASGEA